MDVLIDAYSFAQPGDPFWAQSLALLKFNGDTVNLVPGGITFNTYTGSTGTTTLDGSPKFGSASAKINGDSGGGGTQGIIGTGADTASGWGLTDGDFTVEGWVLMNSVAAVAYAPLFRTFDSLSRTEVSVRCEVIGADLKMLALVAISDAGQTTLGATALDPVVPIGSWFHFALSRQSGVYRLFLNGVACGTHTSTYAKGDGPKGVTIGTVGGFALDGLIDEVRVTKACRYTAAFTPPTKEFPSYAP